MISILRCLCFLVLMMLPLSAHADSIKIYVSPFTVVGKSSDKEEVKSVLQALVSARLATSSVLPVASESEAQIIIQGTLVSLGNQFSADVLLLDSSRKTLQRKAIQGTDGNKTVFDLADIFSKLITPELVNIKPVTLALPANSTNRSPAYADGIITKNKVENRDIIFNKGADTKRRDVTTVPRIPGNYSMIRVASNSDALAVAGVRTVFLLASSDYKKLSEYSLPIGSQIINIDVLLQENGKESHLYVTYVHMSTVYTAVFSCHGRNLKMLALKEPYYTRVIQLYGGKPKLFLQEQGTDSNRYYGTVYDAAWNGSKIVKGKTINIPRHSDIYAFNQFTDQAGEKMTVAYDENGYLAVYDKSNKSIWRSNDKFGGSELFFRISDIRNIAMTGKEYKSFFMNQRIQITPSQDILIGFNDGTLVVGDSRTYKKGVVYNFAWNGSALEEVWRTKESQSYMPDFEYDPKTKTLYQLQLVQREDPFKGDAAMSSIIIKKVE